MKNRKLASRYARALLDALPDGRAMDAADSFLSAVAASMEEMPDFRDAMLDPAVPKATRKRILGAVADRSGASTQLINFLKIVVDHGRTAALPAMAVVFREAREERLGIVPAQVTTAAPIDAALQSRMQAALEKMTSRTVAVAFDVQPDLLGGAVTQIGSTVYDGSLRTQLARLRSRMAEES